MEMATQFTDAQIRTAMLKAADQIEAHPETYDFYIGTIPKSKTEKGCALAWIGYFLPGEVPYNDHWGASELIGAPGWEGTFAVYRAIDEAAESIGGKPGFWEENSSLAAKALRKIVKDSEAKEKNHA